MIVDGNKGGSKSRRVQKQKDENILEDDRRWGIYTQEVAKIIAKVKNKSKNKS